MKFTKGNWIAKTDDCSGSNWGHVTSVECDGYIEGNGTSMVEVWGNTAEESINNAKLISASKDLYCCLFDLMHQIEQDSAIVFPESQWELLNDCEKALKKATE